MNLSNLGFARPELLGLLLLAPLLAALVVLAEQARDRAARAFAGTVGLSARSRVRLLLRSALLLVAFVAVVVALAGPFVDLRLRGARRLGVDIVLAIDVSQSMATRDVEPDRLRAARHLAQALGERMNGSRVSLVLFAGQGTVRYPATTDPKILGDVLDNSGKGVKLQQGSSLAAAIESALAAFPVDADSTRGRAIVVVSDGEITLGRAPDVATLSDRGIKLFTIGVGTPRGGQIPTYDSTDGKFTGYLRGLDGVAIVSKLDEAGLEQIAASAGGRYWRFTGDDAVVAELAGQLHALEAIEPIENAGSVPDERSQLFVGVAVAALLAERLLSDRRRMPSPRGARTATTPRRRGRRLLGIAIGSAMLWGVACSDAASQLVDANGRFAAGDYQRALIGYRDLQVNDPNSPQLSINAGNALHMLTEYPRALPDYAKAIDLGSADLRAVAQYDRGNTLYRLGRLEDARDAYRESLRLDPTDRDAKFNLELVQRLLDAKAQGQQARPGQNAPGATGASGGQAGSGASGPAASPEPGHQPGTPTDQQGDPTSDRAPNQAPPSDLRGALSDFRTGLSLDDALRVLDALQGQQRGVEQLIEGRRIGTGPNPEY